MTRPFGIENGLTKENTQDVLRLGVPSTILHEDVRLNYFGTPDCGEAACLDVEMHYTCVMIALFLVIRLSIQQNLTDLLSHDYRAQDAHDS
jgi:hypothetical protein